MELSEHEKRILIREIASHIAEPFLGDMTKEALFDKTARMLEIIDTLDDEGDEYED